MSKFYDDLKAGLEDIVSYKKGKIDLRSTEIEIPRPPKKYKSSDIKKIRQRSWTRQTYNNRN